MRILVISQRYYPDVFRINDITWQLARDGHQITVITGIPHEQNGKLRKEYVGKLQYEEIKGVKIHRTRVYERKRSSLSLMLNYLSFMFSSSYQVLKIKDLFDQIFVFQVSPITQIVPAWIAKLRFKIPMTVYVQDLWPHSLCAIGIKSSSPIYKLTRCFSSWLYRRATNIAITSMSFEEELRNKLHYEGPIHYLPQYAEEIFDSIEPVDDYKEFFNVMFAGSIGAAQNVQTLVKAADLLREYKDIKFWIVGDGRDYHNVKALAEELRLNNIEFTGFRPLAEMPRYFAIADVFVVTLIDEPLINLTLPGKVQAYMAAGKPIVSASSGETKRIIQESSCGLCTNPEDSCGLAKLVAQYRNKDQVFSEHALNGKIYSERNFSEDIFFTRLYSTFKIASH